MNQTILEQLDFYGRAEVFVQSQEEAGKLVKDLKQDGYNVWIDYDAWLPGEPGFYKIFVES